MFQNFDSARSGVFVSSVRVSFLSSTIYFPVLSLRLGRSGFRSIDDKIVLKIVLDLKAYRVIYVHELSSGGVINWCYISCTSR